VALHRVRPTCTSYDAYVRAFLIPGLGRHHRLAALTVAEVRTFLDGTATTRPQL